MVLELLKIDKLPQNTQIERTNQRWLYQINVSILRFWTIHHIKSIHITDAAARSDQDTYSLETLWRYKIPLELSQKHTMFPVSQSVYYITVSKACNDCTYEENVN